MTTGPESLRVRVLDPSFSVFHYDIELTSELQSHVADLILFAPPVLRDATYPLPDRMPRIKGVTLQALTGGTGRLFGRPVEGYDYFLNELYAAGSLMRENQRPIIHIQFLSLFGRSGFEVRWLNWLKKRASRLIYTVHDVLPPDRHDNSRSA